MLKNKIQLIETRLQESLNPSYLEVLDESEQHRGHSGYQGGGRHFSVTLSSPALAGYSRIEAHRKIYGLFADLIPEEIHALKIKVVDFGK